MHGTPGSQGDLGSAYAEAWAEWADSDDARLWSAVDDLTLATDQ